MKLKQTLWALAFTLSMGACSDEIDNGKTGGKPIEGDGVYLKVNIMTPANGGTYTKAGEKDEDPTGGEYGDGNQTGFKNENEINGVTLILYTGNSINDSKAQIVSVGYESTILDQGYTPSNQADGYHKYQATVFLNRGNLQAHTPYRVLTVANKDVSNNIKLNTGLDQFINFEIGDYVQGVNLEAQKFIMSTHQENNGPKESPGNKESTVIFDESDISKEEAEKKEGVTVWVERLQARIDYTGENFQDIPVYEDQKQQQIATVNLIGVAPVNVATHNIYTFKRVTNHGDNLDVNSYDGFTLLGDEWPWEKPNDYDTPSHAENGNYVLEPTFNQLSKKNDHFLYKFQPEESTQNMDVTQLSWKKFADMVGVSTDGDGQEDDGSKFIAYSPRILCYAGENTMPKDDQLHGRSTGAIFEAQYHPKKLWKYDENEIIMETDDKDVLSKGFYRVGELQRHNVMKDGSKLYADLAAAEADCIIKSENKNLEDFGKNFTDPDWFTKKSYDELTNLVNTIQTPDLGYKAYLLEQLEKLDRNIIDGAQLAWNAFEKTLNVPSTDSEANVSIEKEGNLAIHYYGPNHTCYYQYWIRHANNGDPNKMGVMEFCIVRNNIYQLAVTGVSGLGMPNPYDDENTPDEGQDPKGYYLKVNLFVKDWVVRKNNNIILK